MCSTQRGEPVVDKPSPALACPTDANPHLIYSMISQMPLFRPRLAWSSQVTVAPPGYLVPDALSDLLSLYMYQVLTELVLDKALDCLPNTR